MKNILDDIEKWLREGHSVALATVVKTEGSSPRENGAVMAVNDKGEVTGSISGGCVEAAVIEEALTLMEEGKAKLISYGVADELGFEVGLTCGGTIQVFIEKLELKPLEKKLPLKVIFDAIRKASDHPFALCTMVKGKAIRSKMIITENNDRLGTFGNNELDRIVALDAQELLDRGIKDFRYYGYGGELYQKDIAVFIESFTPPPHLIIFGAVDFTRSLCKLAKMLLAYRVTICDARSRLATTKRFPEADEIVVDLPSKYLKTIKIDHRTIIAVLTHDPKFDVPILATAVGTPAAYIGAMGSRKATTERIERLREAGLTQTEIDRINSPIGLDIGARTPDETAVSIMAEIIAQRNERSGGRLALSQQPIHPRFAKSSNQYGAISVC